MTEEFIFKTKPYDHQLEALKTSYDKTEYALFMEMGCGKSKVIVDTFVHQYSKGNVYNVLIVAPKGVYGTWVSKEIPNHTPDHVTYDLVQWSSSHTQKLKKELLNIF